MTQKVSELLIDFGANIQRIRSDMTQVHNTVRGTLKRVDRSIATTRAALIGLFAGVGVHLAVREFTDAIRSLQELKSVAEATGSSVEGIQSIQGVAAEAGLGLRDLGTIAGQLAQSLNDATSSATGLKAKAFEALRIDPKQFSDTTDLLVAVAKALDQYEDGLNKSRLAMILMGESGKDNIPFLKDLAVARLDAARFTADEVANADRLGKQWDRLRLQGSLLTQELAVGLAPALLNLGESYVRYAKASIEGFDLIKAVAKDAFQTPAERLAELETSVVAATENYLRLKQKAEQAGVGATETAPFRRNPYRSLASDALDELNALKTQRNLAEQRIQAERRFNEALNGLRKPLAPLPGATIPGAGGTTRDPNKEILAEIESLERRAALLGVNSEAERLLYDIQTGRFKDASAGLIEEAKLRAAALDDLEAWTVASKAAADVEKQEREQRRAALAAEADSRRRDLDALVAQTTKAKLAESERLRFVAVEGLFSGRVDTAQFEEMIRNIDRLHRAGVGTGEMFDDLRASVEGFGRDTSRQLTDMLFGGGDSWSGLFERFSREVIENFLYQSFFKEAAASASANLGNALFRLVGVAGVAAQPGGGGTFNGLQPKGDTYNISVQTGVSRSEMQLGFEKAVDQAQSGILTSKRRNGVFSD